jgi:hypothetical protein
MSYKKSNEKKSQIFRESVNDFSEISNLTQVLKKTVRDEIDTKIDKKINKVLSRITPNEKKKNKKSGNRCYTCNPRGKVKKHVIGLSSDNKFRFHHDMNHRPLILVTPVEHLKNITDLSADDMESLFLAIKAFCEFWNIKDYQIIINHGAWKSHEHFHVKIKIKEKIANRMRGDHFKHIKL